MILIPKETRKNIAPLFAGWEETMIWSYMDGAMGKAYADCSINPQAAQVIVGDFIFFAGDSESKSASTLVQNIPIPHSSPYVLFIPREEGWEHLIEICYPDAFKHLRYAFKKDPNCFDLQKLCSYANILPDGYRLVKIDQIVYHQTIRDDWSRDLCSQFISYDDYARRGIGYAIYHGNELVCGASSYTVYQGGIEIEIDTKETYRRKGLALTCAARLILDCCEHGLYPSWDAANQASLALAKKLGYHFDRAYTAYAVSTQGIQR